MPSISVFYGISIYMYFSMSEHHPPHIHARYGEDNIIISIKDGKVLDGYLPKHATQMVLVWIKIHKEELINMWDTQEFRKITPLHEGEA